MNGVKLAKSPCPSGSKLYRHDGSPLPDHTVYRQIVGAHQYCTLTQPEISYSINQLCQHLHAPSSTHWVAAKRVFRYLQGSPDHGLYYTRNCDNPFFFFFENIQMNHHSDMTICH
jgi:hypothetical protein